MKSSMQQLAADTSADGLATLRITANAATDGLSKSKVLSHFDLQKSS